MEETGTIQPKEVKGIDIILPCHGGLEMTKTCIRALYQNTKTPFHLIIMDNTEAAIKYGSNGNPVDPTDTTPEYFKRLCEKKDNITYYTQEYPFKCGNEFFNKAFEMCKYDYVATVMNSLKVEPDWEIVALQLFEKDPKIGLIGFKNLFPHGTIESAGITFVNHMPTDIGRDAPAHRFSDVQERQAVQWAFAMCRLKAVKGILPEDMHGFVGWDDIDNCFWVRHYGWKILYCGLGVGYHTPRATRGSAEFRHHIQNRENAIRFYKRWGFYQKFQEANAMEVGHKLTPELKERLSITVTEFQVLQNLVAERQKSLQGLCKDALKELGVAQDMYHLQINPSMNTWALIPKPVPAKPEEVVNSSFGGDSPPVNEEGNGHKDESLIPAEVL